jgi:hypothetical protein
MASRKPLQAVSNGAMTLTSVEITCAPVTAHQMCTIP